MSALYGRGGVAGTLSYFTLDPFAAGNSVGLKVGSFGTVKPFGTFSQRLSDDAALMVAASHEKSDGWADDATSAQKQFAVRQGQLADGPGVQPGCGAAAPPQPPGPVELRATGRRR